MGGGAYKARGSGRRQQHAPTLTVVDVALEHALHRGVHIVHADALNLAGDAVLPTEIQHLLGLADAADEGARDRLATCKRARGCEEVVMPRARVYPRCMQDSRNTMAPTGRVRGSGGTPTITSLPSVRTSER